LHNLCVIYIRYSSLKTYRTTTIEKLWPSQISRNLGKMVRYGLIGAIKFSQKRMLQKNVTYPGWQILHIWIRIHNMAYCKNCFNNKKILDTFFKDILFFEISACLIKIPRILLCSGGELYTVCFLNSKLCGNRPIVRIIRSSITDIIANVNSIPIKIKNVFYWNM